MLNFERNLGQEVQDWTAAALVKTESIDFPGDNHVCESFKLHLESTHTMFLMYFRLLLALSPLSPLHFVRALRNITIDDTNTTAIQYTPQSCAGEIGEWQSYASSFAYNGSLRFCNDPSAVVTFPFTGTPMKSFSTAVVLRRCWPPGIAVYFLSPLWPEQVTMSANVDNSIIGTINATDPTAPTVFNGPATVSSSVVWSATGLANGPHTLVLSGANTMGGFHYLNIDGIM